MAIVDAESVGIDELTGREWLAVNHIGGYACSTSAGLNTRKYHGLLVASMAPPVRRMVLLSRMEESVIVSGDGPAARTYPLSCSEYPGTIHPRGHEQLRAFSTEPFPRWVYQADGFTIEKTLRLVYGENTVVLSYTLLGGSTPVKLELRPLFALRGIHELSFQSNALLDARHRTPEHHRIPPTSRTPEVFFAHDGGRFEAAGCWYTSTIYRRECERGYAGLEDLWMPGVLRWSLSPGQTASFVCSSEPIDLPRVLAETEKQTAHVSAPMIAGAVTDPALDALLKAADQFIVQPPARAGASGRMINLVTQYPWSAPSGRDALIAFTGLLLIPRRLDDARALLDSMVSQMQGGLMPCEFAEDGSAPKYAGADVSLWFINAVHDYLRYAADDRTVRERYFDAVIRIIRCYQGGEPSLGIALDGDGLLCSHAPGQATSWMDARVGDWVITPRQGRTVELNALWYNAVRIAAQLCEKFERIVWAGEFVRLGESVRIAFNRRFWNEMSGCCFDVVNDRGADPSIRPNQLFAVSLPHAVLAPERQALLLQKVRATLLTPMGLRTLASGDPSYQGHYRGDVVSRDRAYHQGSAYPWLLGPLATAIVKAYGRAEDSRAEALKVLQVCLDHLQSDGLGQICELCDGDPPHHPGGAFASARSVGQVLQAYVEDVLGFAPQEQAIRYSVRKSALRPPVGA